MRAPSKEIFEFPIGSVYNNYILQTRHTLFADLFALLRIDPIGKGVLVKHIPQSYKHEGENTA